jgi:pimeloyl-ACP methyl ester carboxylesterase
VPIFEGGGTNLFYEERGSGQPVVFVHGTLCDYRAWSAQTESLSSGFRTVAYSRRYAHPNQREGDVMDSTVQNNSTDLEALIRGLGLGRVHLAGHSYGGFIAAYFATQHPDLLRSLTLVNAAVVTMLVREASSTAALSLLLRSPSVALSARRVVNAAVEADKAVDAGDRSAPERIFIPALQNGRTGLPAKPQGFSEMQADNARTLREITTHLPTLTALEARGIKIPTLVVWGELSAPWDSKISEILFKSIPGCESARIAGTGHFCLMERPSEVNDRMRAFLLKHS